VAVRFDLWDTQGGNQLETFDTEADALSDAAGYLEVNAPDFAEFLSLGYEDDQGSYTMLAEGPALVERIAHFKAQRHLSA
jgi:hypothetical protein